MATFIGENCKRCYRDFPGVRQGFIPQQDQAR